MAGLFGLCHFACSADLFNEAKWLRNMKIILHCHALLAGCRWYLYALILGSHHLLNCSTIDALHVATSGQLSKKKPTMFELPHGRARAFFSDTTAV
jgi:hypothetical protein